MKNVKSTFAFRDTIISGERYEVEVLHSSLTVYCQGHADWGQIAKDLAVPYCFPPTKSENPFKHISTTANCWAACV